MKARPYSVFQEASYSGDGPQREGYAYDSNGNITWDPLRCFEIRYNLPVI